MKVLVLGATGMIGRAIFGVLSGTTDWDVYGTTRAKNSTNSFVVSGSWLSGIDADDDLIIASCLQSLKPDVVINCIGLTKHRIEGDIPISAIAINSLFPHKLSKFCGEVGCRLIHISTDCIFSGLKGRYSESDIPDAVDLYGRSKILGEVDSKNTLILRTSTIGHEHVTKYGLLEWFLSQSNVCSGYSRAIFSGLPSVIFAKILRDLIIPRPNLTGVYHIAGQPISKYDLLNLIAVEYKKSISIIDNKDFFIDRSLDDSKFINDTGFSAPNWKEMITIMKNEKY